MYPLTEQGAVILVAVTLYVLVEEPSWAVTIVRITLVPKFNAPVKGVVPVSPRY